MGVSKTKQRKRQARKARKHPDRQVRGAASFIPPEVIFTTDRNPQTFGPNQGTTRAYTPPDGEDEHGQGN